MRGNRLVFLLTALTVTPHIFNKFTIFYKYFRFPKNRKKNHILYNWVETISLKSGKLGQKKYYKIGILKSLLLKAENSEISNSTGCQTVVMLKRKLLIVVSRCLTLNFDRSIEISSFYCSCINFCFDACVAVVL